MQELNAITVTRKTGDEIFLLGSDSAGFNLLSFWQWSASDLMGNALRGILAEYIVAMAVGCNAESRTEWDACDLLSPAGVRVEVKSAAYLQSWAQSKLSSIQFRIKPTLGWDSASNSTSVRPMRQAQVYVFCVLAHQDKATVNPLNLDQWAFYCIATTALNQVLGDQKTISFSRLLNLHPTRATFKNLAEVIHTLAETSTNISYDD